MSGKKVYPLNQSIFYRLSSKIRLAKILHLSLEQLQFLSTSQDQYRSWMKEKKSGGKREISAPSEPLKIVQRRISDLLQRIDKPPYIMSPAKGRSYVDNASHHVGAKCFYLLDISDFFPSCSYKKVYWFFNTKLCCSPDVSAILTQITTANGRLPQGSPCSPILAYFAYIDMWDEIAEVASEHQCKLSVYADDITISGDAVPRAAVWAIKGIIKKHGHAVSLDKERSLIGKPADVTGVIVKSDGLALPNRQHKKIYEVQRRLRRGPIQKGARRQLQLELAGRRAQQEQVLRPNRPAVPIHPCPPPVPTVDKAPHAPTPATSETPPWMD